MKTSLLGAAGLWALALSVPLNEAAAQLKVSSGGRHLIDPWGAWLNSGIRGVNDSTSWPVHVRTEIGKTGSNCTRIYWGSKNDGRGVATLDALITNYRKNKNFVMPALWAATGKALDTQEFRDCVDFWVENKDLLLKHNDYLLLNVANEPGLATEDIVAVYKPVITRLRNAGYTCPIVIDAPRWGRGVERFFADDNNNGVINAKELINHDPRKSLVFSWHIYDPYNYRDGTKEKITYWLEKARAEYLCFIVGEFSQKEGDTLVNNPRDIEWQHIMKECQRLQIGWLAWEWYRNKSNAAHRVTTTGYFGDWNGDWGRLLVVDSPHSIKNTSVRTSYLESTP